MTQVDRVTDSSDCGRDSAAYVLGALAPAEASAFRRHLSSCAVCRDEVATLQAVADALPMTAPQLPAPRGLKRRVMSGVRDDVRAVSRAGARRSFFAPLTVRPALAAAVATVAIAAVATAALELAPGGPSSTRVIHASVSARARSASAVLRLSSGHAELSVARMPSPRAGRIYEVWLKRPGAPPQPTTALFDVTSTGAGTVGIPGDLRGVSEVLVTSEPLGGSVAPSEAPVITAELGRA
jgi:anti-sigma-K factor RskA